MMSLGDKRCQYFLLLLFQKLGGDYMIPVSLDEILSTLAGIPAVL